MRFGISAALIAFAFMIVTNCYVARITCNQIEQIGYYRQAIDKFFEKCVSTTSIVKPANVLTFFYVSKIFGCSLFESEFR